MSNNEDLLAAVVLSGDVDVWKMQEIYQNTVNSATKYT